MHQNGCGNRNWPRRRSCATIVVRSMQLDEFLSHAHYFSLGHLPTEGTHPLTQSLSALVKKNTSEAIKTVQKVDVLAVQKINAERATIEKMQSQIESVVSSGARVFLSGCGATGRLALALEALWRNIHQGTAQENAVQALMAGGDYALVKSVENFEDFPEYGVRHLESLGFKEGDLLIAITEGGETPYVIGTVHGALKNSSVHPWFVYCNPRELLCKTVERSREIIENPKVQSLCINVGPMALSGSTRLQAATVQMLSVGSALLNRLDLIEAFSKEYSTLDLAPFLGPVIDWESQCYLNHGAVLYRTNSYPIAVLTDTTERSPTFSLTPFEKSGETKGPYSLCYLSVPRANTSTEAWNEILKRQPIGLDWPELHGRLDLKAILEFDFSHASESDRANRILPLRQYPLNFNHSRTESAIEFQTDSLHRVLRTRLVDHPLTEQLLVKVILNTLSLIVMGKLDRYEGNVMTWVRPSNGKLIDRTLRYLEFLIKQRKMKPMSREALAEMIFRLQPNLQPDQAIILEILKTLSKQ